MLLPSEPELPPKNVATLNALTTKRSLLRGELASHCISDYLGCYDLPRAKDFLRTYACLFYDLLKEAYSNKIATWECEDLIAIEAIQITLACWEGFGAGPSAESWIDTLHKAIIQHVGHSLRGHAGVVQAEPRLDAIQASRYAASGVDIASASPLLKMAIAAGRIPAQAERAQAVDPSNRKALFDSYRVAVPGAGIMDICWAAEQHYREWARWLKGELKDGSKPDRAFRHVLASGKDPKKLRREIRPKDYK
jgi:hypothetical protein